MLLVNGPEEVSFIGELLANFKTHLQLTGFGVDSYQSESLSIHAVIVATLKL